MSFDLEQYLSKGIEDLIKDAIKVAFKNPKQSAFFLRYTKSAKKASQRRHEFGSTGMHIPPFIIASITGECNLNCSGCYSHSNNPYDESKEMPVSEWGRIFSEAAEMGVSVILLAGGEPLLRKDVIEVAAKQRDIIFPVFTNGTMVNPAAIQVFNANRNLIPIISIEGDETVTDLRRGEGIYKQASDAMSHLRDRGVMFGASITVTADNLEAVTDRDFISELEQKGCKIVLFVEYVPFEHFSIALQEEARDKMASHIENLRAKHQMIIISFPGDEAESGGCLAAGRGFFHINASGNAEPCPFSPYSDLNLRDKPLKEAINSRLFILLQEEGILATPHTGGCVLFEQEEKVAHLAERVKKDCS